MLLGTKETIQDKIILYLTKHPNSAAEHIHRAIEKKQTVSIQAIYQALRSLQREGVVVKEKTSYSLRIP